VDFASFCLALDFNGNIMIVNLKYISTNIAF
jgi:hypothetical protein